MPFMKTILTGVKLILNMVYGPWFMWAETICEHHLNNQGQRRSFRY